MQRELLSKKLLSKVRDDDFSHAGESEAITLVMEKFPKIPLQQLLDVGSGLGGTASFIQKHGWGTVVGIDIEESLINYAKMHYPDVKFFLYDALYCDTFFQKEKFDLIYHFNSFYALENQKQALKCYSKIVKPQSNLVIFDYMSFGNNANMKPFSDNGYFKPVNQNNIETMLDDTGWKLESLQDLTSKYIKWYDAFMHKLYIRKSELVSCYDEATFNYIYTNFMNLTKLFEAKQLGGCVVYATKKPYCSE